VANDRLGRALRTATEKAKEAAAVLREEYTKGTEGDTSPTPVLFGTTGYDQIKSLLKRNSIDADLWWDNPVADNEPSDATFVDESTDESHVDWPAPSTRRADANGEAQRDQNEAEVAIVASGVELERFSLNDDEAAAEVSGVLQRIDWKAVSSSTQERSSDVAERMKSLAADVDWERMKPVASKVATALIAAAATGQIGRLSGPTAMAVSRALKGNNVGEAAAALVVRKGPAGVVAGEVMKTFLKPPTPGQPPAPPPSGPRYQGPNVFEANLANLDNAIET
jgi:hypothetical protein